MTTNTITIHNVPASVIDNKKLIEWLGYAIAANIQVTLTVEPNYEEVVHTSNVCTSCEG